MKKDVAIRENHDLYFKKEIIEMNVLYILDSFFFGFLCAWLYNKRVEESRQ